MSLIRLYIREPLSRNLPNLEDGHIAKFGPLGILEDGRTQFMAPSRNGAAFPD